jgi:ribulose-bisphosphate carboxylase large chain
MAGSEWYDEFVDDGVEPRDDDLLALFRFTPDEDTTTMEALGRIASESSVGTWTTLAQMPDRVHDLKAIAYDWDEAAGTCKVAYPRELWEAANVPQILSGVAGNIFGMKAVARLRLEDLGFPPAIRDAHPGPHLGIEGVRDKLGIPERPITATVPKPKLGWSSKQHAERGYEAWVGGVDLIKDDENLTSQSFNNFAKRVEHLARQRERAEAETGETKSALINVTAETNEAIERARLVAEHGFEYAMVDVVTTGFAGLQTIREATGDLDLAIHAHRAMHAMFTKIDDHGMSMYCLAKLLRLVGVDQLHTGTVIGKLVSPENEVVANMDQLREAHTDPRDNLLGQDWGSIKPAFPVASGGLHPGIVPDMIDLYGPDVVIQLGGGIHGHPDGSTAGAKALRDVIDGTMRGDSLDAITQDSKEAAKAIETWGTEQPK